MASRRIFGLAAAILSATWFFVPVCPAQTQTQTQTNDCNDEAHAKFRFLTGQPGLNYDMVGRAIVHEYNEYNSTKPSNEEPLVACESSGSIENVAKLSEGKATFALVQSDVMHSVWLDHHLFEAYGTGQSCVFRANKETIAPGTKTLALDLIAPLYAETLHVLLRPHLNISSLRELKGHRVWVGSKGSGGYLTAERVLGAAGLGMCDISTNDDDGYSPETTKEALNELREMKLDAVFFTGASPTSAIQDALDLSRGEIHLLPLDVDLINQLSADGSYVETMIRKDDYNNTASGPQGIPTVGVQALLIASQSKNKENVPVVESFIQFFAEDQNQSLVHKRLCCLLASAAGTSSSCQLIGVPPTKVWKLPLLHAPTPAAFVSRFYPSGTTSTGPTVSAYASFYKDPAHFWLQALLWVGLFLVVLVLFIIWLVKRAGKRGDDYSVPLAAFVGFALTWTICSCLLWVWEGHVNEDFTSITSAARNLVRYVPPYFAREALTGKGQTLITIVRLILSALFLGVVWPFIKPYLRKWFWNRWDSWVKGRQGISRTPNVC